MCVCVCVCVCQEELCGLRGELGGREEEVGRLRWQLDTLQSAASLTTLPDLLQAKVRELLDDDSGSTVDWEMFCHISSVKFCLSSSCKDHEATLLL